MLQFMSFPPLRYGLALHPRANARGIRARNNKLWFIYFLLACNIIRIVLTTKKGEKIMFNKKWLLAFVFTATNLISMFSGAFVGFRMNPLGQIIIHSKVSLGQKEESEYYPLEKKEKIYAGVVLPNSLVTSDEKRNLFIAKKFLSPNSNWSHALSGEVLNGKGYGFEYHESIPNNKNKLAKK